MLGGEMFKSCIYDPLCQARSLYINESKTKCVIKLFTVIRKDTFPIYKISERAGVCISA